MWRYSFSSCVVAAILLFAGLSAGCGGCARTGSIEGRIASGEGFGQTESALKSEAPKKSGLGQLQQSLSLEGVSVELLRRLEEEEEPGETDEVIEDFGVGRWVIHERAEPAADGSFAFSEIRRGWYAVRLDQPEFGGVAYGADGTDFYLGAGETISLILPLVSTIEVDAPGLFTNRSAGRERAYDGGDHGFRSADTAIIDEESGLIIGGGGGLWVLDPDSESFNMLYSATLFESAPYRAGHRVMYAPDRNEAFIISSTRIVAVDLSVFDDVEPGQALDYDDPEVRLAIGDKVRWSFIDPVTTHNIRALGTESRRSHIQWYFSADESILYFTAYPGDDAMVMIVETDTLTVPRLIFGELITYNVHVDQLVMRGPDGLVIVDASAMQDVAEVEIDSRGGVAPVPGKGEYYVAYTKLSADDTRIPFIAVIDDEGEILSDQRAQEFLGLDYDPDPGAPWFDSTGEYFMLGSQGYRILDDGGFEFLGYPVPWGDAFMERVDCNWHHVFDPVNRYAIWFDCTGGWDGHPGAMAFISTDRGNIPISIRVNSANVLLHPPSGRAFVIDDDNDMRVVHYADSMAAERSSFTRLVAGEEHIGPGQTCGANEPCPFEEVCVGRTDTALTGNCKENERNPFLVYCGGLTRVECDDGRTCELINPTNPDSVGVCRGCPNRDYENHGPRCSPDGECLTGFSCNDNGRCVPLACMEDQDCEDGEVCGMVHNVGRVCVTPGPLGTGEICGSPEDCLSGVCMDTLLEISIDPYDEGHDPGWFDSFPLCTTPCERNADCPEGSNCVHLDTPWPVCVDEGWVLAGDGMQFPLFGIGWTFEHCSPACGEDAICTQHYESPCQVGFLPGPIDCGERVLCSSDEDCGVPGSCVPFEFRDVAHTETMCGFPCLSNSDCPWDADCVNGACNVTWSQAPEQAYYCEDGAGCPDDEWCLSLDFFFPDDPYHCVDEQPCYSDSDCEGGLECHGICTHDCRLEWDASPNSCDTGLQCVHESENSHAGLCLPPICDCPDTGGRTTMCQLDTKRCSFNQTCAPALCDGTYGPLDPDEPDDRTCCRPGNPCELTQEEICQCPPSCEFWTAHYCCHHGDICPSSSNPASLCPDGYECQLVDHGDSINQAYGFICVGTVQ